MDQWLELYNKERTHQGKFCFGKTPFQTFLDSIPLAKEKLIQQGENLFFSQAASLDKGVVEKK